MCIRDSSTTILDILSPTTADTKSRDYIIVDDVYHAYLYITGYGYTTTVGTLSLIHISLTYMVVRSAASQITKAVGKSAGNGGKGAAPNAPSGGPRMGGPSGGHGNTAEYVRQSAAQQSSTNQSTSQKSSDAQSTSVHTCLLYTSGGVKT